MFRVVLLLIAAISIASKVIASGDALRVTLDHGGALLGTTLKSEKGRNVRSFLGIPYAKPPVGSLRFRVNHIFLKHLFHILLIFQFHSLQNHFRHGMA